jgi:hypothetical protein
MRVLRFGFGVNISWGFGNLVPGQFPDSCHFGKMELEGAFREISPLHTLLQPLP